MLHAIVISTIHQQHLRRQREHAEDELRRAKPLKQKARRHELAYQQKAEHNSKIQSLYDSATLALNSGELSISKSNLKLLLEYEPNHTSALWKLASVYEMENENAKAISCIKRIYTYNDMVKQKKLLKLGKLYEKMDETKSALKYYQHAAEMKHPPYKALLKCAEQGLIKRYYKPLLDYYGTVDVNKLSAEELIFFSEAKAIVLEQLSKHFVHITQNITQPIDYLESIKLNRKAVKLSILLKNYPYFNELSNKVDNILITTNPENNLNIDKIYLIEIIKDIAETKLKLNYCCFFSTGSNKRYNKIMLALTSMKEINTETDIVPIIPFLTQNGSEQASIYRILCQSFKPEKKTAKIEIPLLFEGLNKYAPLLGFIVARELEIYDEGVVKQQISLSG